MKIITIIFTALILAGCMTTKEYQSSYVDEYGEAVEVYEYQSNPDYGAMLIGVAVFFASYALGE